MKVYWWAPPRHARDLTVEVVKHGVSWWHVVRQGCRRMSNFGDDVGAEVVARVTGAPVTWAPLARAELVSVGSLLNAYVRTNSSAVVFGSGVREPTPSLAAGVPQDRVVSVRGHLTREALGLPVTTPLGDPALLVREMWGGPRRSARSGAVLLPHFNEFGSRQGRAMIAEARRRGYRVLTPNLRAEELANAIRAAEVVVTSSLHGVVFSDALGTPALLVDFATSSSTESDFKYRDYASIYGIGATRLRLTPPTLSRPISEIVKSLDERTSVVGSKIDDAVQAVSTAADLISAAAR